MDEFEPWLRELVDKKYNEYSRLVGNIDYASFANGIIVGLSEVASGNLPHIELNASIKRLEDQIKHSKELEGS